MEGRQRKPVEVELLLNKQAERIKELIWLLAGGKRLRFMSLFPL